MQNREGTETPQWLKATAQKKTGNSSPSLQLQTVPPILNGTNIKIVQLHGNISLNLKWYKVVESNPGHSASQEKSLAHVSIQFPLTLKRIEEVCMKTKA